MIKVANLFKEFDGDAGPVRVLNGIELDVPEGSLFTLLGPSGCGKTTTLRSVAGLERPSGGEIRLNNHTVYSSGAGVWIPTERRKVGMVFQSYAIWPHMSVIENVMYPLEVQRMPAADKVKRAKDILEKVGLAEFADRAATRLSGGQQQRVALARALVARPQVLLFDEPLSNLDAKLREQLRVEIVALQKEFGITSLYVTHDQEEALAISDRIAIMRGGNILEIGDALTLYSTPTYRFSASFLGLANFIEGRIDAAQAGTVQVATDVGVFQCRNPHKLAAGGRCLVFFRPEGVTVEASGAAGRVNQLQATVQSRMYLGHIVDIKFRIGAQLIRAKVSPKLIPEAGTSAIISIDPDTCVAMPAESEKNENELHRHAA